jgi:cytochrome c biogenesis protein CcmG/thiol:disulfide interchange protein DsbE
VVVVARKAFAMGLVALLVVACSRQDPLAVQTVSRPLPKLAGDTLQGGTFGPTDHAGHLLVVNFWATWCGPCRQEQPALVRTYHAYQDRGVKFVGVDERDNRASAREWVREFAVPYPTLEDPSGSFSATFGLFGQPATYLVDRTGTIRFVIPRMTSEDELSGLLDRLLEVSA